MESRAMIEQAKGIVMATSHCGPDDAFAILVRASQRENRKLRDLASDMVTRHSRPS
jgi:AmiR/NasT family two-component response regulator